MAPGEEIDDNDFTERLEKLSEELNGLTAKAHDLESLIFGNLVGILAR